MSGAKGLPQTSSNVARVIFPVTVELADLMSHPVRARGHPSDRDVGAPRLRAGGAGGRHGGHRRPLTRNELDEVSGTSSTAVNACVRIAAGRPAARRPLGAVAAQRPAVPLRELPGAGRPVGLVDPSRADGRFVRARGRLVAPPARHRGRAAGQTTPPIHAGRIAAWLARGRGLHDQALGKQESAKLLLVLHPAVPDPRIHETGYRVGAWRWPRGRFLYGAKSPFFSWTRSPASTPYCETGDSSGERAL